MQLSAREARSLVAAVQSGAIDVLADLDAPRVLEAVWGQLSITHSRLNAAVPEIRLQRAVSVPRFAEYETSGVPQHGWMHLEALICRNRANLSATFWFGKSEWRYSTSCSNAISVPGRTHTATFGSPTAANPRVKELSNLVEISLSPTFAGRDATKSRL